MQPCPQRQTLPGSRKSSQTPSIRSPGIRATRTTTRTPTQRADLPRRLGSPLARLEFSERELETVKMQEVLEALDEDAIKLQSLLESLYSPEAAAGALGGAAPSAATAAAPCISTRSC